MTTRSPLFALSMAAVLGATALPAQADDMFEITLTNATRGQIMSPPVIVVHRRNLSLFELGQPASPELAALAQDADTTGLVALLEGDQRVSTVLVGGAGLEPGASSTFMVPATEGPDYLSLVSMLVTTNDAFVALEGARAPNRNAGEISLDAYDAGSEGNDELCAFIPGPPCGNGGATSGVDAEGYVHVHAGIQGVGDLSAAELDWRNPVAEVHVRRISAP